MHRPGIFLFVLVPALIACGEGDPRKGAPGAAGEGDAPPAALELAWKAPAGWTEAPAGHPFQVARLRVDAALGGPPLELTISHEAGGLGGAEANVARWIGQFRRPDGTPATSADATITPWRVPGPETEGGVRLTTIVLGGTYIGRGGENAPDHRLAGAIATLGDGSLWYLKLVGPRLEVEGRLGEIEALWSSLRAVPAGTRAAAERAPRDRLAFDVPAGWRRQPVADGKDLRYAELEAPGARGAPVAVVVYHDPRGMGSAATNVERWLGQVRNADGSPLTRDDAIVLERRLGSFETTCVDAAGAFTPQDGAPREGWRLLGAIARGDDGRFWYFRAVGPAAEMVAVAAGFEALLASLRYEPMD